MNEIEQRHNWEIAVNGIRKYEREKSIDEETKQAVKSIDREIFTAMFGNKSCLEDFLKLVNNE
jgi:hypothetical protein